MKSRNRRKLFWSGIAVVLAMILAVIIVPPFINLDHLGPRIESAVFRQTGMEIKIGGHVRLSLLGRATITAYDIKMADYGNATADSVSFRIPFRNILDVNSAVFNSVIIIDRADMRITSLIPPSGIVGSVVLRDSAVTFMDKRYDHINGILQHGMFNGTVRTDEHKYTIRSDGDTFLVTNPTVDLNLAGQLFADERGGLTAVGSISLETDDINKWFAFAFPKIRGRVKFRSDFEWANNRFRFHNISGTGLGGDFSGVIEFGNGAKKIGLVANGVDFDFTPIINSRDFWKNSEINFSGNGRFILSLPGDADFPFAHNSRIAKLFQVGGKYNKLNLSISGDNDAAIKIKSLRAENRDSAISAAGTAGSIDLKIYNLARGIAAQCELVWGPNAWSCRQFDYRSPEFSAIGAVAVDADSYNLKFISQNLKPENIDISNFKSQISNFFGRKTGRIEFQLTDGMHGAAKLSGRDLEIEYSDHRGTSIAALPIRAVLPTLPDQLLHAKGTVKSAKIKNNSISFLFEHSGRNNEWQLSLNDGGEFAWGGDNIIYLLRAFYPDIETSFLRQNLPGYVGGKYRHPYVTDLEISIGRPDIAHIRGNFDGRAFDLHADVLDLDELADRDYIDNYTERAFLTAEPLTLPFLLGANISLSADKIKFGGEEYENFNYSLKPNLQKMSVTDAARGSFILSIEKRLSKYIMGAQFNRFEIMGLVLSSKSPLNVADTTLTAQLELETFGITAHDFWANVAGDIDMTFDGGFLIGFDFDRFYGSAKNITKLSAEYAISDALSGGDSVLKSLHLAGFYDGGDFITTSKLSASARHTEISGGLQIRDKKISADLSILLRGTSPAPRPISLRILPNGGREFSLTDIMQTFDPDFMREFVKTHDKF